MIVSQQQRRELSRGYFYTKLHDFLSARARREDLKRALKDRPAVFRVWDTLYSEMGTRPEYRAAVLLTYALCRQVEGQEHVEAVQELLAQSEPEYTAKCYFEDLGFLRFSEFDL